MMKKRNAFTLIELLVVIAIIALLLAVIVPSLRLAKEKAKTVICKSNLHQWGVAFASYTSENDNKFMPGYRADPETGRYTWVYALIPYYQNPDIRLCPMATRSRTQMGLINPGMSPSDWPVVPEAAWDMVERQEGMGTNDMQFLLGTEYQTGSYGVNWWCISSGSETTDYSVYGSDSKGAPLSGRHKWRRADQSGSSRIPVLSDAGFMLARPSGLWDNRPPKYDGQFDWPDGRGMPRVCTNRHSGTVNLLYMDWSVNPVGLKDLWIQEWHRNYPQMTGEQRAKQPWGWIDDTR